MIYADIGDIQEGVQVSRQATSAIRHERQSLLPRRERGWRLDQPVLCVLADRCRGRRSGELRRVFVSPRRTGSVGEAGQHGISAPASPLPSVRDPA
jgi:hypothetical protein